MGYRSCSSFLPNTSPTVACAFLQFYEFSFLAEGVGFEPTCLCRLRFSKPAELAAIRPLQYLLWRRRWDSNPRSSARQADALAAMLLRHVWHQGQDSNLHPLALLASALPVELPWCVVPPTGLEPVQRRLRGIFLELPSFGNFGTASGTRTRVSTLRKSRPAPRR